MLPRIRYSKRYGFNIAKSQFKGAQLSHTTTIITPSRTNFLRRYSKVSDDILITIKKLLVENGTSSQLQLHSQLKSLKIPQSNYEKEGYSKEAIISTEIMDSLITNLNYNNDPQILYDLYEKLLILNTNGEIRLRDSTDTENFLPFIYPRLVSEFLKYDDEKSYSFALKICNNVEKIYNSIPNTNKEQKRSLIEIEKALRDIYINLLIYNAPKTYSNSIQYEFKIKNKLNKSKTNLNNKLNSKTYESLIEYNPERNYTNIELLTKAKNENENINCSLFLYLKVFEKIFNSSSNSKFVDTHNKTGNYSIDFIENKEDLESINLNPDEQKIIIIKRLKNSFELLKEATIKFNNNDQEINQLEIYHNKFLIFLYKYLPDFINYNKIEIGNEHENEKVNDIFIKDLFKFYLDSSSCQKKLTTKLFPNFLKYLIESTNDDKSISNFYSLMVKNSISISPSSLNIINGLILPLSKHEDNDIFNEFVSNFKLNESNDLKIISNLIYSFGIIKKDFKKSWFIFKDHISESKSKSQSDSKSQSQSQLQQLQKEKKLIILNIIQVLIYNNKIGLAERLSILSFLNDDINVLKMFILSKSLNNPDDALEFFNLIFKSQMVNDSNSVLIEAIILGYLGNNQLEFAQLIFEKARISDNGKDNLRIVAIKNMFKHFGDLVEKSKGTVEKENAGSHNHDQTLKDLLNQWVKQQISEPITII